MAQFHHPELGGSGQWMRGGMLTLGDMWNDELKGRVNRVLSELTELLEKKPVKQSEPDFPSLRKSAPDWWGENLGKPSASGSQNSVRYAFFPTTRRLAILDGDK